MAYVAYRGISVGDDNSGPFSVKMPVVNFGRDASSEVMAGRETGASVVVSASVVDEHGRPVFEQPPLIVTFVDGERQTVRLPYDRAIKPFAAQVVVVLSVGEHMVQVAVADCPRGSQHVCLAFYVE